jgi:hypothetical protein
MIPLLGCALCFLAGIYLIDFLRNGSLQAIVTVATCLPSGLILIR